MNLLENGKYFMITFILTLVLGYYLGLAVSTVVDYRLRDAAIHMPKPKNNIIIKMPKSFSEKPKVKVDDNSKQIENFLNFKPEKKSRKKRSSKKKQKTKIETFENPNNNDKYPSNPTLKMRDDYYGAETVDKTVLAYAQNLIKQNKDEKTKKVKTYIPYNYEENSDNYTSIDKKGRPSDNFNERIKIFKSKDYTKLAKFRELEKDKRPEQPWNRRFFCPDSKKGYLSLPITYVDAEIELTRLKIPCGP